MPSAFGKQAKIFGKILYGNIYLPSVRGLLQLPDFLMYRFFDSLFEIVPCVVKLQVCFPTSADVRKSRVLIAKKIFRHIQLVVTPRAKRMEAIHSPRLVISPTPCHTVEIVFGITPP
jgi:hypothetical protein